MNRIPHRIGLWAVLLALGLLGTPAAHAQGLGITAGLNFNELSDIDTGSTDVTFENASGWHVGLWFDLPLGPVAVRPGVRYMDAGSLFEGETFGGTVPAVDYSVDLIEVPVDIRIRLNAPIITPYIMAGPVLRFSSGEEEDVDFAESFNFAAGLGAGVEVNLGGLRLFPELKYTFGITRFSKDTVTVGGVEFTPDEDTQLNTIMLSLGLGL